MSRKFLVSIDLNKNELQNAVIQNLATAPSSPLPGQVYFDTVSNTFLTWSGTAWISGGASVGSATPTVASVAQVGAVGVAVAAAREDHSHAGPGFAAPTAETTFGTASAAGSATTVARADHTHGNPAHNAAAHSAISLSSLAVPTADLAVGGFKITGLATPTAGTDAVTKAYADTLSMGLDVKASVRVATTVAGTLATSFANGSVVDGVTLVTGDRILIKNQAAGAENGIYIVAASGAPTRATDFNSSTTVTDGAFAFVQQGTLYTATGWLLVTQGVITVGTTAMVFTQFSGSNAYTSSNGVLLTGSNFTFAPLTSGGLQTAAGGASIALPTNSGLGLSATGLSVGAGTGILVATGTVSIDTAVIARKFSTTLATSATSYTITHNLGTLDAHVQVYALADGSEVMVDNFRATTNTVTLTFATAPTANAFRVVVIA